MFMFVTVIMIVMMLVVLMAVFMIVVTTAVMTVMVVHVVMVVIVMFFLRHYGYTGLDRVDDRLDLVADIFFFGMDLQLERCERESHIAIGFLELSFDLRCAVRAVKTFQYIFMLHNLSPSFQNML